MSDLSEALDQMAGQWMTGGSALDAAPAEWRAIAEADAEPDLCLLAIAGQAAETLFYDLPPRGLEPRPLLPRLELPPLQDGLRRAYCRLRDSKRVDVARLLALMASRGVTAHPGDGLPKLAALPDVYAPWVAWAAGATEAASSPTEVDWDALAPSERVRALSKLRRRAPAEARALLEAKATTLPAEPRLRAVETLGEGLSDEDTPFLESLANDRSAKVRALAAGFLARLGRAEPDPAQAAELADVLKAKGATVSARPLKTAAQRTRRAELFRTVTLGGLATALDLTPEQLVTRWRASDAVATEGLAEMVARTASDADLRLFLKTLIAEEGLGETAPLLPRLSAGERQALTETLLADGEIELAVACAGAELGRVPAAPLFESAVIETFQPQIDEGKPIQSTATLDAFGLLATADAAEALIVHFTEAGMYKHDPALDMLQFNAALRTP